MSYFDYAVERGKDCGILSREKAKEHFQYPGKSGTDAGNREFFEGADQEVQSDTTAV
jgi:hypothetical protein